MPGHVSHFSFLNDRKLLPQNNLGEYWTQQAHGASENRGKQLRRDAFTLAQKRYGM